MLRANLNINGKITKVAFLYYYSLFTITLGMIMKSLKYQFLISVSNYFLFVRKRTFQSIDWYVYHKHDTMEKVCEQNIFKTM